MNLSKNHLKNSRVLALWAVIFPLAFFTLTAGAKVALNKTSLEVETGGAARLELAAGAGSGVHWESSDSRIAEVFQNGFVVGLTPGQARVRVRDAAQNETAECLVTVEPPRQTPVDPASLKQYPDNREFMIGNRKCYGSELNGQRASGPDEKRFTSSNRIINPRPLRRDKPLDWEVQPGTEVYDGAGVFMGTVASKFRKGDTLVPVSMFNFGMSKVLNGRLCLYAFSVAINPTGQGGTVETSAWLPLDRILEKETLLERDGLGKPRLPALPLEPKGYAVTGGNPRQYETEFGELSIVRKVVASGPVPSHYLRRPSGTINLIYSVPGFGLGGQGTDSFLISDALEFYPAKGAKVFQQPTYYPIKHPRAGQVSPQTMTFLYGAIQSKGAEPVYGWIAKEALGGRRD